MNSLIQEEYHKWKSANNESGLNHLQHCIIPDLKQRYLGLEYGDLSMIAAENMFAINIPPMQVIGDWTEGKDKLLLISLEPKYNSQNFNLQRNFIIDSNTEEINFNNYIKWQKDYFKSEIQDEINTTDNRYWIFIKDIIQGFKNDHLAKLDDGLIELPLIPMHSIKHNPKNICETCVRNLFKERLSYLIMESGINKILCLGNDTEKYLKKILGFERPVISDLIETLGIQNNDENIERYGKAFLRNKIEVYKLNFKSKDILIFARNAMTNGNQPKSEGRSKIGKIIGNQSINAL